MVPANGYQCPNESIALYRSFAGSKLLVSAVAWTRSRCVRGEVDGSMIEITEVLAIGDGTL